MRTTFSLITVLVVVGLLGGMLVMQAVGRKLGERDRRLDPEHKDSGSGAAEAAVIALLGLLVAFTFSGAGSRYDARRQQIIAETNAIGTAWRRIDLLPPNRQPEIRDLFRQYADNRLETFRSVDDMAGISANIARGQALQQRIWSLSVAAAGESGQTPPFTLLVPALNEMIDLAAARNAASRIHPPGAVFFLIGVLALVAAMFAGYSMADQKVVSLVHRFGFPAVMTVAVFLILNFEFPRLGLIRIDSMDQLMIDVRRAMN